MNDRAMTPQVWTDMPERFARLTHAVATGEGDLFEIAADYTTAHARAVYALADKWRADADAACPEARDENTYDPDGERSEVIADTLRVCATNLETAFGLVDTESSVSRQHFIDTGRYLRPDDWRDETTPTPAPGDEIQHPEHTECADGCGLAVTHDGACRERPGGRVVCSHDDEHPATCDGLPYDRTTCPDKGAHM
jgi:hypothetical protein